MKIALACHHGAFALKEAVRAHLEERGIPYEDLGTHTPEERMDYPKAALAGGNAVKDGRCDLAFLFCRSGIRGISAACKMKGIHPAACSDTRTARLARQVSNCNALCLGWEIVGPGLANEIVDAFVDASFEGGRHLRYLEMIDAIEDGTLTE